jgi:hypothetical protein
LSMLCAQAHYVPELARLPFSLGGARALGHIIFKGT